MTKIVKSTIMMVTIMVLLSFMINLMTTRAAVFALHGPVIKGGTTVCLSHDEASTVSVGGQQLSTNDDTLCHTWDVWLWKKSRMAIETDHMDIGKNRARYRNLDIPREQSRRNLVYPNSEDNILSETYSISQSAMAPSNLAVQWQLTQDERVEYLQTEGFYRHAASDRRTEGKKEDEMDREEELIKKVPQRTERPMATVQLTVIKSEAVYFDAEVPVRSADFGVYFDGFHVRVWSVPWDVWLIEEEKRLVNAMTDGEYRRKPAATPQVTTTIDPKEILSELCLDCVCLLS